jgi:hypothetical protein
MKTNLNRQQLLAFAAIGIVALFLADKLILAPLSDSWKKRADEITKLRKSNAQGRALMDRDKDLNRRWSDIRKNSLPLDMSQAEQRVLKSIYTWSSDSRITISSAKPQWKRGVSDDYSTLECRVEASGSLSTIARFLYEVEHSPDALKIDAIEISSRDNAGSQLALGLLVSGLRLAPLEGR